MKGLVFIKMNKYMEAINLFITALNKNPDLHIVNYSIGYIYNKMHE